VPVQFGLKIPNHLGKNVRKPQGDTFLTHNTHISGGCEKFIVLKFAQECNLGVKRGGGATIVKVTILLLLQYKHECVV